VVGSVHDIPGEHQFQVPIPAAAAADATAYLCGFRVPFKCTLVSVRYIPVTGNQVGVDTNTNHLNVDNQDHATPNTEIANLDLTAAAGTVTGGDAKDFTLSATSADLALAEGDVLRVEREKIGTGTTLAAGNIVFTIKGR
jgi:hypothetical protein